MWSISAQKIRASLAQSLLLLISTCLLSSCGLFEDEIVEPIPNVGNSRCPENNDIDVTAAQQLVDDIERTYGIDLVFNGRININSRYTFSSLDRGDLATIKFYLDMFNKELARYPRNAIRSARIQTLGFVKDLTNTRSGNDIAGLATSSTNTMVIDIYALRCSPRFVQANLHHEVFHMIDFNTSIFSRVDWSAYNPAGFTYGEGGSTVENHPFTGFVSGYATTNASEDRAETFTSMMSPHIAKELSGWIAGDTPLRNKVAAMKSELYQVVSREFTTSFWDGVSRQPSEPHTPQLSIQRFISW